MERSDLDRLESDYINALECDSEDAYDIWLQWLELKEKLDRPTPWRKNGMV